MKIDKLLLSTLIYLSFVGCTYSEDPYLSISNHESTVQTTDSVSNQA